MVRKTKTWRQGDMFFCFSFKEETVLVEKRNCTDHSLDKPKNFIDDYVNFPIIFEPLN